MTTVPLCIHDLSLSYGSRTVVDGISMTVEAGEVRALLGPNGAGKSSTVACAVGLRRPAGGSIRIFGADPLTEHARTAALAGVMLQDGGLPMSARPLPVLEHLARLYEDPADVSDLAHRLGIDQFASRTIRRLSGGQRQRVALAAAMVGRPRLLFLDEPTAGLDPQARIAVDEVIAELRADGVAIVLTTHDMADAEKLADTVTVIDDGRVIAAGTVGEVVGSAAQRTVRMVTEGEPPEPFLLALAAEGVLHADRTVLTLDCGAEPEVLHRVTGIVAAHGVALRTLEWRGRSLGDVFLELTGRSLR
ncbi:MULTISPECIES: ABC transporter ATP-binding protein [Brevibacterium]|jgi:ABC-2 type transport system ATP-binding protein|uniref:ABC transporter ATP-binding protein n=1 Tax=Brevibacterium salitolerans TaxID=1403566 RepID=A0ABN2WGD0_9MICO|nr:ABC transporter ATP-binding protein [Brevibacterium sp.]